MATYNLITRNTDLGFSPQEDIKVEITYSDPNKKYIIDDGTNKWLSDPYTKKTATSGSNGIATITGLVPSNDYTSPSTKNIYRYKITGDSEKIVSGIFDMPEANSDLVSIIEGDQIVVVDENNNLILGHVYSADEPEDPFEGLVWINSSNNQSYVYNGSDFELMSGSGGGDGVEYTAGDGIAISNTHEISSTYTAGTNIQISDSDVISATDTTYTAGDGLELSSTEFSIADDSITEAMLDAHNSPSDGQVLSYDDTNGLQWEDKGSGGGTYTAGDGLDLSNGEFSLDIKDNSGLEIDSTELSIKIDGDSLTVGSDGIRVDAPSWTANTEYKKGTILQHNNGIFLVYGDSAASSTFNGYFEQLSSYVDSWVIGAKYEANTWVHHSTQGIMLCKTAHTSTATNVTSTNWYFFASSDTTYSAGTGINIDSSNVISSTVTNTDTTYTAGDGLDLTSGEFSVEADGASILVGSSGIKVNIPDWSANKAWKKSQLLWNDDALWMASTDIASSSEFSDDFILVMTQQEEWAHGNVYWPGTLRDHTTHGLILCIKKHTSATNNINSTNWAFLEKDTTYTAGTNVQISSGNVISATDTTYTAGTNVSISNANVISATDTNTEYTAGTNVQISGSNVISATDTNTTYTAGDNIAISGTNVISSTDTDTTYSAGTGMTLTGTSFSVTNPFTDADETKLDGIATGAEVNVQADWNQTTTTDDSFIKNKPTITDTTYTAGDGLDLSDSNEFSISDDSITEDMLDSHNSPTSGQFLQYDTTNKLQWATVSSGGGSYSAGTGLTLTGTSFSISDDGVTQAKIADDAVGEAQLDMHNSPTDGQVLTYDTTNGLQWETPATTSISDDSVTEAKLDISNSPTAGEFLQYKDSTDSLTWATPTDTTYTAGDGLNLTGTTFKVDDDSVDEAMLDVSNSPSNGDFLQYKNSTDSLTWATPTDTTYTAGTNISISGSNEISSTDTNTTYSAGTGIALSGTTFSVADDSITESMLDAHNTPTDGQVLAFDSTNGLQWESKGTPTLNDDSVTEAKLDVSNSPTAGEFLQYKNSTDSLTWATPTDTTYTAGTGITLSSGSFSVTNPFTDADETKLDGIATGAEVNVQPDWNQTTTTADDYIKNKPTITDTNTTYTAGDGLDLNSTTFSADLKSTGGLEISSGEIAIKLDGDSLTAGSSGLKVSDDEITEAMLDVSNSPTAGSFLQYKNATDSLTWATPTDTNTEYTAGTGISISGSNVISSTVTDTDTTYTAGTNVSISNSNVISATDTNTTYTAGNGLDLSSTTFSVDLDGSTLTNSSAGIKISDGGVDTTQLAADSVTQAKVADGAIDEPQLDISNSPSDGHYLQYENSTNGMKWAAVTSGSTYTAGTGISISDANVITATGTAAGVALKYGQSSPTDSTHSTTTSWSDLFSLSVSGLSTASRVWVQLTGSWEYSVANNEIDIRIINDSDSDVVLNSAEHFIEEGASKENPIAFSAFDSSPVTGSNTYKVQVKADTAGTLTYKGMEMIAIDMTSGGGQGPAYTAGTNIAISNARVISATDTDTTYTAGTGLTLSGTEFSVTNPFTDVDETKLDGIETGAEVNVQADWDETDTNDDSFIQNKPTINTYTAGTNVSISNTNVISATDTDTTYTAGTNVAISNSNVISATDTNTTYSAGNGLDLTGTSFSVDLDGSSLSVSSSGLKVADDGIGSGQIANDAVGKDQLNSNVAGNGITQASDGKLDINDGDGLELSADKIKIKLDGTSLSVSSSGIKVSDDSITEAMLDIHNTPTDGQVLAYDTTNGLQWEAKGSGGGSGDITAVVAGTGLTGGATTGSATLNVDYGSASDVATGTATNKSLNPAVLADWLDSFGIHERKEYTGFTYETGTPGTRGNVKWTSSNNEILINMLTTSATEMLGRLKPGEFVRVEQSSTIYVEGTISYKLAATGITGAPYRVILKSSGQATNGTFTDGSTVKIILESRLAQAVDDIVDGKAATLKQAFDGTADDVYITPKTLERVLDDEGQPFTTWTGYKYATDNPFTGAVDGDVQYVILSNPTRYRMYIKPKTADKSTLVEAMKKGAAIQIKQSSTILASGIVTAVTDGVLNGAFDFYEVHLQNTPIKLGTFTNDANVEIITQSKESANIDLSIANEFTDRIATTSEFITGTSTTDLTTVKQVRDFGKAASSIATKWNGEVNPVTAGLASLSPYSRASGGAATYYSATNDRWELMRAGVVSNAGNKVGNLVFQNPYFDYTQMAMSFQLSMDLQASSDGNSWIDMYWGAASTDLDSTSDNWIGTATKGLYVRCKRKSTNNKVLMSIGINDSTIRSALGSKTGGWQNRYYLPNYSGNFEFTSFARASSSSNTEEAFEVDVILGDTTKVWITFNVFNEFLAVYVDGILACTLNLGFVPGIGNTYSFGPKFGICGDDGGGVPTAMFGYLHAMILGTPDPLNALPENRPPTLIANPSGTPTNTLTKVGIGELSYTINDTTYTAGNGLNLASESFSIDLDGSTLSSSSTGLKISDGGVGTTQLADDSVTAAKIADDTIPEVALDIHDTPAVGEVLGYTSNGMEWVSSGLSYDDRGNHTATFATAYVLIGLTNDWVEGDLSGDIKDGDLFTITISKYKGQNTSQGGAFSMSGKQLKNLEEAVVGDTINAANYDQRKIHTQRIEIMDEGGSLQSFDLFFARSSTNGALIAADDASRDCDVHISRWGGV